MYVNSFVCFFLILTNNIPFVVPPVPQPFAHRPFGRKRDQGRDISEFFFFDANKERLSINKERLLRNNLGLFEGNLGL